MTSEFSAAEKPPILLITVFPHNLFLLDSQKKQETFTKLLTSKSWNIAFGTMTLSVTMNGNIIDTLYYISDFCFSPTGCSVLLLSVSHEQLPFFDERLFRKYLIEVFKHHPEISERNEAIHHSKTDVPFISCGPRRCALFFSTSLFNFPLALYA